MKVLVTGSRGLVGSQIAAQLKKKGHGVITPSSQELNLLQTDSVNDYFQRIQPEMLIHSAWYTAHGRFWTAPENEDWALASLHLAKTFYSRGGRKFIGLGTCAEYEWPETAICEEDQSPLKPATLYGQKKLQFQRELERMAQNQGREFLWGRVFFPYGPGEKPTRVIPLMIQALISKKPIRLTSGVQKRDFMYTEDLGDLIATLALSEATGTYNVSSGEAVSLREIAQILCEVTGQSKDFLQFSEEPLKEPLLIVGSAKKRESIISWQASHTLAQGLEKTFNWWQEHQNKK